MFAVVFVVAGFGGICGFQIAHGQIGDRVQRRLIDSYDFEERDGPNPNFEALPRFWFTIGRRALTADPNFLQRPAHAELVARRGYPEWNDVKFDNARKRSGEYSLKLGLNGGSAGAFLQIGALPAVPSSDYLISFFVNTTELKHASAYARAYLVDSRGNRIEESVGRSIKVRTDNQWQKINIKLHGDYVAAAWLMIELLLEQPAPDPQNPLGKKQVVLNEVSGAAWFDDVTVWQLPRVTVKTGSDVSIIRMPEKPTLSIHVRDLSGQPLQAEVRIYDHRRALVAAFDQVVGRGSPPYWTWRPPLPRFGWYLIDLKVYEVGGDGAVGGEALARSQTSMLWLGPEAPPPRGEMKRFGIDGQELPLDQITLMPELVNKTGLGALTLSVWGLGTTPRNIDHRQQVIDEVFRKLPAGAAQATGSLYPLPKAIHDAVRSESQQHLSPLTLLASPTRDWLAFGTPVFVRQGQNVRRWQLGHVEDPEAFYRPDLRRLLDEISGTLLELTPKPRIVLPWSIHQSRRPGMDETTTVLLSLDPSVRPETIPEHTAEWHRDPAVPFELHLREPPADIMAHTDRINGLARRMLFAAKAGASGLTLTKPWTRVVERQTRLLPDPLLGVFSTVAHRLAGRKMLAEMEPEEGIKVMIFGPQKRSDRASKPSGMLAVWNENAPSEDVSLRMFLGEQPVVSDVWGNRAAVPMERGKHVLKPGRTPVFVEGIDTELAIFRSRFKLEPGFVESIQAPQDGTLTLHNPWGRTISGTMIITQPESWFIEPRNNRFSIAPGESSVFPVRMIFPISEIAEKKRFEVRLDFVAEDRYKVDVAAPLELGLEGIDLDATLTVDQDSATGNINASVTTVINNTGSEPLTLFVFAHMPQRPRERHIVTELLPGQSVIRRFLFPDVGDVIFDQSVRVGLTQTDGDAVLNKRLSIDAPN